MRATIKPPGYLRHEKSQRECVCECVVTSHYRASKRKEKTTGVRGRWETVWEKQRDNKGVDIYGSVTSGSTTGLSNYPNYTKHDQSSLVRYHPPSLSQSVHVLRFHVHGFLPRCPPTVLIPLPILPSYPPIPLLTVAVKCQKTNREVGASGKPMCPNPSRDVGLGG